MAGNPVWRYKPQWAFKTPKGYRDELFLVPFHFVVPGNGQAIVSLPWQLDDDVPFIIRGIVFPEIGLNEGGFISGGNTPGMCRIRDTQGNPLSSNSIPQSAANQQNFGGRILALGVWSQSAFGGRNAFGFPLDPEIECAPGGAVLFDFQLSTNATIANFFHPDLLALGGIEFDAAVFGTAGNAFSIHVVNPGAPNIPLSVAVVAGAVTVTLATNGGGALISTFLQVEQIINNTPAVRAVMSAQLNGAVAAEIMDAFGPSALSGGEASVDIVLDGTLIGVKRFKEC